MAEELKTEENISTQTDSKETQVTITQDKLDQLINGKFKAGATKATTDLLESLGVESIDSLKSVLTKQKEADEASKTELQKAQETITTLNSTLEGLQAKLSGVEADTKITSLAAQHGIKEVDYFKYEYERAAKTEGFDETSFMENMLKTKGTLLTGNTSVTIPNTKNVNNDQNVTKISMADYSMLNSAERAKYKPNQITKD